MFEEGQQELSPYKKSNITEGTEKDWEDFFSIQENLEDFFVAQKENIFDR